MPRFSNWREDLAVDESSNSMVLEVITDTKMTDTKDAKKVKEKKINNAKLIKINPQFKEAIEDIGGEILEMKEIDGGKENEKQDSSSKQLKNQQKRVAMMKRQILMRKMMAVKQGGGADIVASYEPDIEGAIEYFYEEGINEEGIDQLIEEIGLEAFVDFVEGGSVELNEERAARKASVRAKKYDVVKKEVDKADAARKKAKKGEYAPSYAKKETDVTVYDDKPAAKKKAPAKKTVAKKAAPKPVAVKKTTTKKTTTKKVVKAVAKVKQTQPAKKATKQGLGDKIRSAYKAGVKRHRKATQGARVFGKGFASGAKKAVKFAKDVKKVVSEEELIEGIKGEDSETRKAAAAERRSGVKTRLSPSKGKNNAAKMARDIKFYAKMLNKEENTLEKRAKENEKARKWLKKDAKDSGYTDIALKASMSKGAGVSEEKGCGEKSKGRHPRDQKELDKAQEYIKKNPNFGKVSEAKVDKGRSDYGKASIRNYRSKGPGYGEPAMFDPENKRGKLIDKRREDHKARRGVKGAKVPAYKTEEVVVEDKALAAVKAAILKKHGKGAIYDPKKKQSSADKAKVAAERKKRQDADNKAYASRAKKAGFKSTQDYTNVVARYGSEDNYNKGKGLGT